MKDSLLAYALTLHEFTKLLGSYQGQPAIFMNEPPSMDDHLWDHIGAICHMQIMKQIYDEEACGKLSIEFLNATDEELLKNLCSYVTTAFHNMFFLDHEKSYIAVLYKDSSEIKKQDISNTYSQTVNFDLLDFSFIQDDMVVQGLSTYLSSTYPDLICLKEREIGEYHKIFHTSPICYLRKRERSMIRSMYSCLWISETIDCYVFTQDEKSRMLWIDCICEQLLKQRELILPEGNPFIIQQVSYTYANHPLRKPQLQIIGEFGLKMKETEEKELLNHVNINT